MGAVHADPTARRQVLAVVKVPSGTARIKSGGTVIPSFKFVLLADLKTGEGLAGEPSN